MIISTALIFQQLNVRKNYLGFFFAAFSFINDAENWHAILTLAEYILSSNKTIIDHEDIITVLDNNKYFLARTNSWF